jgi:Helix-turn-helix domain
MPVAYTRQTNKPKFKSGELADTLTVNEAAAGAGVSSDVIRAAIKSGALEAFTIGAEPGAALNRKGGRGKGYRIRRAELERWFFGQPKETSDGG